MVIFHSYVKLPEDRYKHHHSSGALQVISVGASICIALDGLSRLIASPVLAFDARAAGPTALIHGDLVDGAIIISPAPNDLEQLGFVLKVWRNRRCFLYFLLSCLNNLLQHIPLVRTISAILPGGDLLEGRDAAVPIHPAMPIRDCFHNCLLTV